MKKVVVWVLSLVLLLTMAGCEKYLKKSFTFNVETGDAIKVEINALDDYDLSSDVPFTISCDGEQLSQGIFVTEEQYQEYAAAVQSDSQAKILETDEKDGNAYIFWNYNDSEWNYLIWVADSNTGVLLGNPISEDSARECFDRLTLTVEK